MTAEVALMNRMGVALAADSAVTLGNAQKVYTSAEKLFQLCEDAPVGIMVYGGANFMHVPWETVVKVYRSDLEGRCFDALDDYAADFLRFLKREDHLHPPEEQENLAAILIAGFLSLFMKVVELQLEEALDEEESLSPEEIKTAFEEALDWAEVYVESLPQFDDVPENLERRLAEEYDHIATSLVERFVGEIPRTEKANQRLNQLLYMSLLREQPLGSGIVIAGYGESEHFPALSEIWTYGCLCDELLYRKRREGRVDSSSAAWILPFAQQEMVYAFMEGVDPQLRDTIERSTEQLFRDGLETILEHVDSAHANVSSKMRKDLTQSLDSLLASLFQEWARERKENFSDPVTEIVSALPKDELAAMAEALVNLTKFKRRVSRQQETVSGPIDVAVITKGDGFVWIKRKHYFRPELNPRYLARIQDRGGEP